MELEEAIKARKKYLQKEARKLERKVRGKPEWKLRITNGRYYCRSAPNDRNGTYLADKKQAAEIAQTDYYRQVLKSIYEELKYLEKLESKYPSRPEQVYEKMNPARRELVDPVRLPDDEFLKQWLSVTWEPMPFRKGAPKYKTDAGYYVRSKSELVMANTFVAQNVPHRYEYPIYLEGYGQVRPDFIVLNVRTRKEFIWEHCGMMDKEEYLRRNLPKFRAYRQNGLLVGDDIIVTTESSVTEFDPAEVEEWIQRKLR